MRLYEVLTGEVVQVYANDEAELMEKISAGDYQHMETETVIRFVSAELGEVRT